MMTREQITKIKEALDELPPPATAIAGYEVAIEAHPGAGNLPSVLLRWPDTDEGRAAVKAFVSLVWRVP
jgi:hypothetical protein